MCFAIQRTSPELEEHHLKEFDIIITTENVHNNNIHQRYDIDSMNVGIVYDGTVSSLLESSPYEPFSSSGKTDNKKGLPIDSIKQHNNTNENLITIVTKSETATQSATPKVTSNLTPTKSNMIDNNNTTSSTIDTLLLNIRSSYNEKLQQQNSSIPSHSSFVKKTMKAESKTSVTKLNKESTTSSSSFHLSPATTTTTTSNDKFQMKMKKNIKMKGNNDNQIINGMKKQWKNHINRKTNDTYYQVVTRSRNLKTNDNNVTTIIMKDKSLKNNKEEEEEQQVQDKRMKKNKSISNKNNINNKIKMKNIPVSILLSSVSKKKQKNLLLNNINNEKDTPYHQSVIVEHNYHDHANDSLLSDIDYYPIHYQDDNDGNNNNNNNKNQFNDKVVNSYDHQDIIHPTTSSMKHSLTDHYLLSSQLSFPMKLYNILETIIKENTYTNIISWQPHGRCFMIHDPILFKHIILPTYFNLNIMSSFQRQLNLYNFKRITSITNHDKNGYYHEYFLRGRYDLLYHIHRIKIKGTWIRAKSNPFNEPNFWKNYKWVTTNTNTNNITSSSSNDNHNAACINTATITNNPTSSIPMTTTTTTSEIITSFPSLILENHDDDNINNVSFDDEKDRSFSKEEDDCSNNSFTSSCVGSDNVNDDCNDDKLLLICNDNDDNWNQEEVEDNQVLGNQLMDICEEKLQHHIDHEDDNNTATAMVIDGNDSIPPLSISILNDISNETEIDAYLHSNSRILSTTASQSTTTSITTKTTINTNNKVLPYIGENMIGMKQNYVSNESIYHLYDTMMEEKINANENVMNKYSPIQKSSWISTIHDDVNDNNFNASYNTNIDDDDDLYSTTSISSSSSSTDDVPFVSCYQNNNNNSSNDLILLGWGKPFHYLEFNCELQMITNNNMTE